MLRGFRWQFAVLVMALVLFVISLTNRTSNDTPSLPQVTITPVSTPEVTLTPVPGVVIEPEEPTSGVVTTYREGLIGSIQRLNPLMAGLNPVDQDISSLIFEGLTRINQYGEPEPALAENWVVSSNGLEYIIRLRSDILWQDGIPFTVDDVLFTMAMLRSTDFPGPAEVGVFWRTVETEMLGDGLVRFRLTQPLGSFLEKLRIGILPAHALQGTTAADLANHPFNLSPIGTGPYQLEALRTIDGDQIQTVDLRVAPVYSQRPESENSYTISRLRFHLYDGFDDALQALDNGEIDGLATQNHFQRGPLLNTARTDNLQIYTTFEPTLGVLIFNWQKESVSFFREQRVRLGLETGMDRASVIERHLPNAAVQADSPLLPGSWAYAGDLVWPPYDPNTARFLLETANLRTNRGSEENSEATEEPLTDSSILSFTILTPDDPALVNLVREIATQWSQLNLNVNVEPADQASYQARLDSGDFDAALVELSLNGSTDPDVYAFWHQGQYPDGENYGGVDDRRVSEMLERARQEFSGINRDIYYDRFQRDFVDRAIALPIYYPLFTYVTASNVDGVQLGFLGSASDRFQTLQDWMIEED